jgi:hypothetical protein
MAVALTEHAINAGTGSRNRTRHRPGLPAFDVSQPERPACGWCLLFEGLGRPPSARIKRLPPKKTDTVSREERTRRRCCFFGS